MPRLTPTLRTIDSNRGARLLVAWMTGDQLALQAVLHEADSDPQGTAGLLFAVAHTAAMLAEQAAGSTEQAVAGLRAVLLDDAADPS